MELKNEFRVAVPVEKAWQVLTDVERIAPCMPGAELHEVEGDTYRGVVKIKVGPITAQYKGTASFVEKDDAAHRAVLQATGRDTRGQGNASAKVTATLVPDRDGTSVTVETDLTITGKVAQFGRGVLADVSSKLIGQFVHCLETDILSGQASPQEAVVEDPAKKPEPTVVAAPEPAKFPRPAPSSGPRRIESTSAEPVDLLGTAGAPVVKRIGPVIGVLVVVLWLLRRRRR